MRYVGVIAARVAFLRLIDRIPVKPKGPRPVVKPEEWRRRKVRKDYRGR